MFTTNKPTELIRCANMMLIELDTSIIPRLTGKPAVPGAKAVMPLCAEQLQCDPKYCMGETEAGVCTAYTPGSGELIETTVGGALNEV